MGPEQIAPVVLFALLVAGGLYFVVRPLGSSGSRESARAEGKRIRLLERKAVLVQLLRDLDFDLKTGKLSDADYLAAKEETESRALEVLAELDALSQPWSEERIEAEIRAAQIRLRAGGQDA